MTKVSGCTKIEVEPAFGTPVEITSYVKSITFDEQTLRQRGGLLGWIGWKYKIKWLMWVKG